jgi:hypothetical protein
MQQYLLKEEAIASVFSLETRYPLLAIKPFLSFLYDYQPEYTISYKGPIEAELKSLEFPYDITRLKRGFNPFSMDRSEAFLDYFSEIVIQAEEVWL